MDDERLTASDRRKTYQKNINSGKGHSLDDTIVANHSTGGLKAAASESQLNENDSFLCAPKEKHTSSKISLLADKISRKMLDTAKNIAAKQNKKTRSSFPTIFRKSKSLPLTTQAELIPQSIPASTVGMCQPGQDILTARKSLPLNQAPFLQPLPLSAAVFCGLKTLTL